MKFGSKIRRPEAYCLFLVALVQVSSGREMETNYGSVGVNGALQTCALEAFAALLLSALIPTQLLALVSQINPN